MVAFLFNLYILTILFWSFIISLKGVTIMTITATEAKANLSKYITLSSEENVYITKNGHIVAMLTKPVIDKTQILNSLIGIIPADTDVSDIKGERLADV